jgi:hypothetical protein
MSGIAGSDSGFHYRCVAAIAIAMAAALAGCAGEFGMDLPEPQCRAAGAASQLGRLLDERAVEAARMGAGAMRERIVRQGQIMSPDVDPQRLNIEVDDANVIRRLRCG